MPRSYKRTERIGDLMQQELALLFRHQARDPRFSAIAVGDVTVSRDLSQAKVYVSQMDEEKGLLSALQAQETMLALNNATGFFRSMLAKVLNLRIMPRLVFIYDETLLRSQRVSELIDQAIAADQAEVTNEVEPDVETPDEVKKRSELNLE